MILNGIKEDMTMKKMNYTYRILASLLIAATAMTACSKEESATEETTEVQQEGQGYTMTLTASKDITTKALTQDGKKLTASWDEGEEVIAMQKDSDGWKTLGTLKADASSDGSTTLRGELENAPNANKDIVLFLHSSNLTYASQKGTLESLKEKGDYAKATIYSNGFSVNEADKSITVDEDTNVEFSALQAIVKFTFQDKKGNPVHVYSLTIHDNGGIMRSKTVRENGETDYENDDLNILTSGEENYMYVAFCNAYTTSELVLTARATEGEEHDYISYTYTKKSPDFEHGCFYDITVKMDREVDLSNVGYYGYTAQDGDVLTGKKGYSQLKIADGATVTLRNVNIGSEINDDSTFAGITCEGDASLILEGENTVTGCQAGYAGIFVPEGKTLTIQGDGALESTGKDGSDDEKAGGAGIGGNASSSAGHIVIKGGTVTAIGGFNAAGIGCGAYGTCGDITITNEVTKVSAIKDSEAGGYVIGAGYGTDEKPSSCGTIKLGDDVMEQSFFAIFYGYTFPDE